jgi:hypothetical protein
VESALAALIRLTLHLRERASLAPTALAQTASQQLYQLEEDHPIVHVPRKRTPVPVRLRYWFNGG